MSASEGKKKFSSALSQQKQTGSFGFSCKIDKEKQEKNQIFPIWASEELLSFVS